MSTSHVKDEDAGDVQPTGEFHAKIHPSEPLTRKGHQVGSAPGDRIPTSHVETYPPGTAPEKDSYVPHGGANVSDNPDDSARAKASDTILGADSADVHKRPGAEADERGNIEVGPGWGPSKST